MYYVESLRDEIAVLRQRLDILNDHLGQRAIVLAELAASIAALTEEIARDLTSRH